MNATFFRIKSTTIVVYIKTYLLLHKTLKNMKLDDLQLAVMKALWKLGKASVTQVRDELEKENRDLAVTTIGTVLSRLEKKGAVSHDTEGKQYIYTPLITEVDTRKSMLGTLLEQFFGGNPKALVNHLVDEGEFDKKEIEELKKLLKK
jgi:BlaI family transcriptional regulator, penicillinase repressor